MAYWLIAHLRAVGVSVGAVFIYHYSPQRRVAINFAGSARTKEEPMKQE